MEADICILGEGTYPYNAGGVAQWVHELIEEHQERTFHVLTLMPPRPDLTFRYKFPKNVIGHTVYIVQDLPPGAPESKAPKEIWEVIGPTLEGLISSKTFNDFTPLFTFFTKYRHILGKRMLSESMSAWNFTLDLYSKMIPSGPFKAYFGTIFTLSRSLFSVILPELPKAKLYHAVCTGYAGFLLHRAKIERGTPGIVTEHGIYSNERRIEIAMADWIAEMGSLDLALEDKKKTLKDFWLNAFLSFAYACYNSSDAIISTFDGNLEIQLDGGADPKKVRTIVHGIEEKVYAALKKEPREHPPTVAFIGRIVPIKDVKTFIRACQIVKEHLPEVRFWALGPAEEDPEYFIECKKLVDLLGLNNDFKFFGRVNLKEYFQEIDLIVFTSLSEAQPLVILEMGALGIPFVATNVGACRQLLYGSSEESPPLGQGGIVIPLVNSDATAKAIIKLLTDHDFYKKCSQVIEKRIRTYYSFEREHEAYRKIYAKFLNSSKEQGDS